VRASKVFHPLLHGISERQPGWDFEAELDKS